MAALDRQIEQAKNADDRILKKDLKRKQKLLLINARNDFVKEGLRRNYAAKIPGGVLEVFCVSNQYYGKFSKKGNVDYVNASGIPDLRRFCHTITAKPQYFEAKHFLQSSLPSLLTSTSLWSEKGQDSAGILDDEAKEEAFKGFGIMSENLKSTIKRTGESLGKSFQEQLLGLMENRNVHWECAAKQESSRWSTVWTLFISHKRIST